MVKKQQVIDQLQSLPDLEQEVKDIVVNELSSYPEEMEVADLEKFDAFVAKVQYEETITGQALNSMADTLDKANDKYAQSAEDQAFEELTVMKSGLQNAQDLAAQA